MPSRPKKKVAAVKRGRGQPSKYQDELAGRLLVLAAEGASDEKLARAAGIGLSTFYAWKARHPDFKEALTKAKNLADEFVELALYQIATGYTFRSLKMFCHEGAIITEEYDEHVPPNLGAIKTWLGNRRPDKWKEPSQRVEHTGKNGGPIKTESITVEEAKRLLGMDYATLPAPAAKVEDL